MSIPARCLAAVLLVLSWSAVVFADPLDDSVAREMKERCFPGISISIVKGGRIVRSQGYGRKDKVSGGPVTPQTLFQAGSISKPVTALAALTLVEKGKLSLDADVNGLLRSWKVPDNEFVRKQKVTLAGILSHSAGFTVHGFRGYSADGRLPTLLQVLDGQRPANSAAIRVAFTPGSRCQYSGGGYVVLQQLLVDVTGRPFPDFMADAVLRPLGMSRSTFEQPLPEALALWAASGHAEGGARVQGGWRVYPEMSAAGLWTTPDDLCRFIASIQSAWKGRNGGIISPSMARTMLTRRIDVYGLGFRLEKGGATFFHGGRDEGFDAFLYASADVGVVIMMNANDSAGALGRLLNLAWAQYGR